MQFNEKVKESRQDIQDVTDNDYQLIADLFEAIEIESDKDEAAQLETDQQSTSGGL